MRKVNLSKYTAENFAKVNTLLPQLQPVFRELLWRCAIANVYVRVVCGYRSEEEQANKYAQGRTIPGNIVTNAKAGWSFHQYKCAMDIVPLIRINTLRYLVPWQEKAMFAQIAYLASELGIEQPIAWDLGHLQYDGGNTIEEAKDGNIIKEPNFEAVALPKELARARERLQNDGIIPLPI
jgi:peptidoglycan L-alanyl-D-glutamate endopeptidase CwlK|tara:strand:+ start:6744 stop:7283 length:540 start_codon:yes stop_codon:yes gene_type:complete